MFMGAGPSCFDCAYHQEPPRKWWQRVFGVRKNYEWYMACRCALLNVSSNDERWLLNRDGKCGPLGNLFKWKTK